jgi:hypothetical protein
MKEQVPFVYAAWRARMGWSKPQAAEALGVSRTQYWKLEKAGMGSRLEGWAAYGIEQFKMQNGERSESNNA